jgi:hypothetical protein
MEPRVVHRLEQDSLPISCRFRVPTEQAEKLQVGDIVCVEGKDSRASTAAVGSKRGLTLEIVDELVTFHAPASSFENP